MLPRVRPVLVLLAACLAAAADGPPSEFTFTETIAGRPVAGIDPDVVAALTASHRQRLVQARAELATATPLIARLIRADIGAYDAEITRLAVAVGGTIEIGRRTYSVRPDRIVMASEGMRIEVDPATGAGLAFSGQEAEGAPIALAPAPEPVAVSAGTPGAPIRGMATLVFSFAVDGRDYRAAVAPGLVNPFARLIPREGEDAKVQAELGRLPGMPLELVVDTGEAVRRLTCVDAR